MITPIKNGLTPSYALSQKGRDYAARSAKIAATKAANAAEDGAQGEAPAEDLHEAARLQHTALSRAIADLTAAVQALTKAQAEDRSAFTKAIKDLREVWE